jgi:hypothetical protein
MVQNEAVHRVTQQTQGLVDCHVKLSARFGQLHTILAVKQAHGQLVFQRPNPMAHRAMRQMQFLCGLPKILQSRRRLEDP